MFERYTEKARRVIFFARYEASQLGASQIDAEHLLLGVFREDKQLAQELFRSPAATLASIRKEIEEAVDTVEKTSTSIDLPLSQSAKRVLSLAADESDRLQHRLIHTDHLLLGLIKEEKSFASQILCKCGITAEKVLAYLNAKKAFQQNRSEAHEKEFAEGIPGGAIGGVAKGYPSLEERTAALANQSGLSQMQNSLNRLLDLLVQKGLITEEEKEELNKTKP